MSYTYFKSNRIKVFPCAYRGTYEQSANIKKTFDPEARLNTEYNLVHTSCGLKDSYIIEWKKENEQGTSYLLRCVIGGYYFEISSCTVAELKDKFLEIKTKEETIVDANTFDAARKTKVLKSWNDETDLVLDKESTTEINTYYFYGLQINDGQTVSNEAEAYLKPILSDDKLNYAEFLPNISAGSGTSTIDARTLVTAIHTESNTASGEKSFAIGDGTAASGQASLSAGKGTKAIGIGSISAGENTEAAGSYSIAVGMNTKVPVSGGNSIASGTGTTASGLGSHAEGTGTYSTAQGSHSEGNLTIAGGDYSHAEGYCTNTSGIASHAEGYGELDDKVEANGKGSHAEGYCTHAMEDYSHAEGKSTKTLSEGSHAEGESAKCVYGIYSHAEGKSTKTNNSYAHAEGENTDASGHASHAEGYTTKTTGNYSHAEGANTIASGDYSHAEGDSTDTNNKQYAHVGGNHTKASANYQTVIGKYNADNSNALFIVGKGDDENNRKNALAITPDDTTVIGLKIKAISTDDTEFCKFDIDSTNHKTTISSNFDSATKGNSIDLYNDQATSRDIYLNVKDGTVVIKTSDTGTNPSITFSHNNNQEFVISSQDTKLSILKGDAEKANINESGEITATSFIAISDKRLKENIVEYKPKKSILDLPIYKYDFINGPKNQIGCLAQDLREICPELVSEDSDGYLSIKESKLIYLLLAEIKELKEKLK